MNEPFTWGDYWMVAVVVPAVFSIAVWGFSVVFEGVWEDWGGGVFKRRKKWWEED